MIQAISKRRASLAREIARALNNQIASETRNPFIFVKGELVWSEKPLHRSRIIGTRKKMNVSWDYSSQYMENRKCSKPPTSNNNNNNNNIDHKINNCWLVVSTPLKNMKVSWDDYSQYNGKS